MVDSNQTIESNFHLHLTEHLNSEVVLGTITDLPVAMEWLTSTFFYLRAKKHPKHYGLPIGLTTDQLDKKLLEMCQIEINKLAKAGMLSMDETTSISPMLLGFLMTKYYLAFDTMKLFKEINGSEILPQMLNLISNCKEFSDLYLRVNDKKALNLLNRCRNKETIRFPLNGRIKTLGMKINCLIQAVFGCLEVLEHSLQNDAQKIIRSGERISKCLLDYLESPDFIEVHPKAYSALLSANILAKCFHTRLWENSKHVARQLSGIGVALSGQLVAAGKTSFDAILEGNPRDLERILGRKPPLGNKIQELVAHLPKFVLQVSHEKCEKGTLIKMRITLTNASEIETNCTVDKNSFMVLLVGDSFNNIYIYEKFSHDFMMEHGEIEKSFETFSPENCQVNLHFISQTWVGIDCNEKVVLNSNQEKEKPTNEKQMKPTNPKQTEEKTSTVKKPPVTIQQFIDVYMKKTKPISKREEGEVGKKITPPKNQADTPDSYKETSESENDSLLGEEESYVTEKSDKNAGEEQNCEKDLDEENDDKIIFDIMEDQYDDISSIENTSSVTEKPVLKNNSDENTVKTIQKESPASECPLEFVFKDDEDFNAFCEEESSHEQLQPDSTSCEQQINSNTSEKSKNICGYTQQMQKHRKMSKNDENTQKAISWRSPLIISPCVNHSPHVNNVSEESSESEQEVLKDEININKNSNFSTKLSNNSYAVNRSSNLNVFDEKSCQSEKNEVYTNKSCQDRYSFSVKLLDNSCATPALKPLTQYSQLGPMKKQPFKFHLADKPYKSQTQPHRSEKLLENFNSSPNFANEKSAQPQENFHYQTIKIIDRKKVSPPKTSQDVAVRGGFSKNFQKPIQEINLKSFMSQFKKDDKKTGNSAISYTQPVYSKWGRFTENYEATPSCSKWNDYLPKENDEESFIYQTPPVKRKSPTFFKFDSPQTPKRPTNTSNFIEWGLSEQRPLNSRVQTFPTTPKTPQKQFSFTQETAGPSVNFHSPPQFKQTYFAHAPAEESVFNHHVVAPHHPPYYSQPPAMHYFAPPARFPPQRQCAHCNCCQGVGGGGVYFNSPPETAPYMPYSHLPCESDEEMYF